MRILDATVVRRTERKMDRTRDSWLNEVGILPMASLARVLL